MFRVRKEARLQFDELEEKLASRNPRSLYLRHDLRIRPGVGDAEGDFYHRVGRRVAKRVRRTFQCRAQAIKKLHLDEHGVSVPVTQIIVSFT